jgi:hypothetical protein
MYDDTAIQLRSAISRENTEISRLQGDRRTPVMRRTEALRSTRVDPEYVDILDQEIARFDQRLARALERKTALDRRLLELQPPDEVATRRTEAEAFADQSAAATVETAQAEALFITAIEGAATAARTLAAVWFTAMRARSRVIDLNAEFALNAPVPVAPEITLGDMARRTPQVAMAAHSILDAAHREIGLRRGPND